MKYVPVPTRPHSVTVLECAECRQLSRQLRESWLCVVEAVEADPGPEVVDNALQQLEQALERHRLATSARLDHESLTGHSVDDPSPLSKDPGF